MLHSRGCQEHTEVEEIIFTFKKKQTILKGRCIDHGNKYTVYHAIDKESGELYVIKEIYFNSIKNNIEEVKAYLSKLVELKHENLFAIKNFVYIQTSNQEFFYILQQFDFGYTSLSWFLNFNVTMDDKFFQLVMSAMTDAIKYLKEQNIEHANVSHSSVYFNHTGDIKLYDYGLESLMETSEIQNLLNHYQQFFKRLCPETTNVFPETNRLPEDLNRKKSISKLNKDFEIIRKIGKGAFGKVYQVQDKEDRKHYALKKIKLRYSKDKSNIINEVEHLAQLEHKHIVRYYHAWRKYDDTDDSDSDEDQDDDDDVSVLDNITNLFINCTLYIKMEYCEGNTLEYVIDQNYLYQNSTTIWKYFKEITKGLQHIHNKNIIHRDLKPSNIYLDSNNHIKIGDFGLSTSKLRYRSIEKENKETRSAGNQSYTTRAGTHYYKAPELYSPDSVICNYKLDMYSLGIILFEMCYHRFNTAFERERVLSKLRSVEILFPEDFDHTSLSNQKIIISDLLNHNDKLRPSCQDLMKSTLIPHFLEEKEEEKQLQTIKRIANDPGSSLFQHFFTRIFEKDFPPLDRRIRFENVTFLEVTIKIVTDIFRKHGGENYETITNDTCTENCRRCTKAIDKNGQAFVVPCDSRVPFLKYAILKNYSWIRRYSIQKTLAYEPNCDFNIITPIDLRKHNCYIPDAELLLILYELINAFPNVYPKDFTLSIFHSDLIEVILKECSIIEDPNNIVMFTFDLQELITNKRNISLCFGNYRYDDHIKFMKMFSNFTKSFCLPEQEFKYLDTRLKAELSLRELVKILAVAKQLGVNCDVNVDVAIQDSSNQYSGMMVHIRHKTFGYIAFGGRYDKVLESVCEPAKSKRYGVGLSIYPLRLLPNLEEKVTLSLPKVLICVESNNAFPELHKVLRILWKNNISCSFIKMASAKSCNKYCLANKFLCVIKVNLKLLNEGKVLINYQNNPFQNCVIGTKNLVLIIKTLLQLEPENEILLKDDILVQILFSTDSNISFFDKAKYKCQLSDEIKKLPNHYYVDEFRIFVVDFDIKLVIDSFKSRCKPKTLKKLQSCVRFVCEDILEDDIDEDLIVLFANILPDRGDVLHFQYYTYKDYCFKMLNVHL